MSARGCAPTAGSTPTSWHASFRRSGVEARRRPEALTEAIDLAGNLCREVARTRCHRREPHQQSLASVRVTERFERSLPRAVEHHRALALWIVDELRRDAHLEGGVHDLCR